MSLTAEAPTVARMPGRRGVARRLFTLLLGWEIAGRALDEAFVLAAPSEVLAYLVREWALMGRALSVTLANAAVGFPDRQSCGRGAGHGGPALAAQRTGRHGPRASGLLSAARRDRADPAGLLRARPGPQITLAALAVYYTTLIPLLVGLRAAPASWFDLVRSYGRGRLSALLHVRAMASLPYLLPVCRSPRRRPSLAPWWANSPAPNAAWAC
jgi:sulfonate transport system permease protein